MKLLIKGLVALYDVSEFNVTGATAIMPSAK
jgi:hypothetical protein